MRQAVLPFLYPSKRGSTLSSKSLAGRVKMNAIPGLQIVIWRVLLTTLLVSCFGCNGVFRDEGYGLDTAEVNDPGCEERGDCKELCRDGVDNDGDGRIDCMDPDCSSVCVEICDDGEDNDGDGQIDCKDLDCVGECNENCSDGKDNDGDGLVDCQDPDCVGQCVEECEDGLDNDGDGLVDCEDGDCFGYPTCTEICDDGIDNDGDGLVDCVDDECWGPACHDSPISSWVNGGRMTMRAATKRRTRWSSVCGTTGWSTQQVASGTAQSVSGSVLATPKGATSPVQCKWTVGNASFAKNYTFSFFGGFRTSSTVMSVQRRNVQIEPGCGIHETATWFLPNRLYPSGSMARHSSYGGAWYSGIQTNFTSTGSFSWDISCSSFFTSSASTASFNPLLRGDQIYTNYP